MQFPSSAGRSFRGHHVCDFLHSLFLRLTGSSICEYALHRLLKKQRRLQALEKLGIASRSSIESTVTLEKPGQMHLVPDRLLTLSEQRNLARRNSLSSQRAVYPYGRSTFDSSRSASLNHGSTLSSSNSSGRYARSTVHSASDSSISDKTVSLTLQASRSSASGSLYSRRRPTLDLKAIPESPRIVEPIEPAKPPPAWCPPLKHAPLSADPTIRALVDGAPKAHLIETSKSSCNKPTPIETPEPAIVAAVDTESTSGPAAAATPASPGQPSLIQSTSFPLPPVPAVPKLPPRAPGHPARSKSSGAISNGSSRRARDRYQPSQLNMGGNLRKPSPSPYASKYRGLWTHGQGQVQGTSGWPSGTAWPANQSQGQIPMQSGQNLMVPSMTTGNLAAPHLRPSMYSMSSYGTRSSTGASAVLGGR